MKEIRAIAKDRSLPGWEVPVDIILEPCSFSAENGLLTSTLKKSRPRFEMKYKDFLEDMYEQMNSPASHRSADINYALYDCFGIIYRPLEIVVFEWMRDQLHQGPGKTKAFSNERGLDCDMIQKSFSQLGGDSLAAMHLSSLLREHLSLDLPVDVILKTPLADIPSGADNFRGDMVHFPKTGHIIIYLQRFAENLQINKAKNETAHVQYLKDQRKNWEGSLFWKLQELCKPLYL